MRVRESTIAGQALPWLVIDAGGAIRGFYVNRDAAEAAVARGEFAACREQTAADLAAAAEPGILTAKTWFWGRDQGNAQQRAREEARHTADVAAWFTSLGMSTGAGGGHAFGAIGEIRAEWRIYVRRNGVEKTLTVTRRGCRSNITLLRKLADPAQRAAILAADTRAANRDANREMLRVAAGDPA